MATENNRFKMSEARLEELKKRLEFLQTERTAEVAEQLKEARSYGDLSENSEYDEAKTEQGKVYSEIAEIKNLIENAEIVQETNTSDQVGIGTRVTIKDIEYNELDTFQIVGSQEADPDAGKISDDSPLGKALMGGVVGQTIEVAAPVGTVKFQIKKIEK
ncbi:MAG: transcription elongation factor GreA [Oscillospiraceae bacterium]|nr:transcription elongation factor GreA [Oscillospiraceae bacterium]